MEAQGVAGNRTDDVASPTTGTACVRSRRFFLLASLGVAILAVLVAAKWSGFLLVAGDPLPSHVDAAVVLQGSISGEMSRVAGAMALLQRGTVSRVLLSVPRESYWGESIPPIAARYLERTYGAALAGQVDFCETEPEVNSTEQEARVLASCIRAHGWQAVAVVTSNYHTRRARILWRKVLHTQDPSLGLWVTGVPDPAFQPSGWWRQRLYAKTWLLEFTKLMWAWIVG